MSTKIWLEELSFGSNFGNLRAFGFRNLDSHYTRFKQKKTAFNYLNAVSSFSVHKFCGTDRQRIHVYTYLDYFSNLTPILTKVSIPFFPMENSIYKQHFSTFQPRILKKPDMLMIFSKVGHFTLNLPSMLLQIAKFTK